LATVNGRRTFDIALRDSAIQDHDMPEEVWLRGPVPGVEPMLMPVVHSLLQVKEEIDTVAARLTDAQVWERPGGAASAGFHIRHIGGSSERLLTYARGEQLSVEQLRAAERESTGELPRAQLLAEVHAALDRAIAQVRAMPSASLWEERKVGRRGLPSTTFGLLFHVAEHALRHAGQAITTARIVAGQAG
jgi:uncharacterized damage-inducible protein DinB